MLEDKEGQIEEKGEEFHFEIITVDSYGKETNRSQGTARQKVEDLGNGVNLKMVYIPSGTFMMGSPDGEGDDHERPQHHVTITLPFYIGKYPITQEQYQAVMGENPSHFRGDKKLPVESVTWRKSIEFCAKLSNITGKKYRLPSEAEWEYACRAGTNTPFHFGETLTTQIANYNGNYTYAQAAKGVYRQSTTPVGSFLPNAFGLYDMHGNVWEWCLDPWHDNYQRAPSYQSVWDKGNERLYEDIVTNLNIMLQNQTNRVLRGGSWFIRPKYISSGNREKYYPDDISLSIGFRVVAPHP